MTDVELSIARMCLESTNSTDRLRELFPKLQFAWDFLEDALDEIEDLNDEIRKGL